MGFIERALWRLVYPFPRSAIEGRVRPLCFTPCAPDQISACEQLYARNEAYGLPPGARANFADALRGGDLVTLLAYKEEELVGTFSLNRDASEFGYHLCWLIVAPEHHRTGVGSTMMLASLAVLKPQPPTTCLYLTSLPHAVPFYQRFGCNFSSNHEYEDGVVVDCGFIPDITNWMISGCRRMILQHGCTLPAIPLDIPMRQWVSAEDDEAQESAL